MKLPEILRRRVAPPVEPITPSPFPEQPEINPTPTHPDMIALDSHPLRFYPGFDAFVTDWNQHVETPDRRYGYRMVQRASGYTAELERKYGESIREVDERISKREEQIERTVFETAGKSGFKREVDRPVRKAKYKLKSATSEKEGLLAERDRRVEYARLDEERRKQDLQKVDIGFAFAETETDKESEERVVFFAATRLSEPERVDELFAQYSRQRELGLIDLRGINVDYLLVRGRMDEQEVIFDDAWELGQEAAKRQRLDLVNGVRK